MKEWAQLDIGIARRLDDLFALKRWYQNTKQPNRSLAAHRQGFRESDPGNFAEVVAIQGFQVPVAGDDLRDTPQLSDPDGRLRVCHAVIVADALMPIAPPTRHAMVAQFGEALGQFR